MIKGAILDMDGVLVDSLAIWEDLRVRYLCRHGIVPEKKIGDVLFSMSLEEGCAYVKKLYGLRESVSDIRCGMEELLRQYYREEAQAYPGAKELLELFRVSGIPMVLATSTPRELAESALERLGFLPFFRRVLIASEFEGGKRSPAVFLAGAAILGTAPEETLVFEDSLYALETAGRAGFRTVGVYAPDGEPDQAGLKAKSELYLDALTEFTSISITDK